MESAAKAAAAATTFTGWRSYTLVELPMLMFFFGQTVTGAVGADLMLYRSCQAVLGLEKDKDCELLHTNTSSEQVKEINAKVQPYVTYVLMYKSLVDGLVPALLSFFLGPWSDGYGRKPLLVAGYAGSSISFLLWSILSSRKLNPWIYLTASVPPALAGGYFSLSLATYCYITDIRKEEDRAWHMTWVQAAISVGQLSGNFAGPVIFEKFGYVAVFGAASLGNLLATLYVLFLVPESVSRRRAPESCSSLFDLSLIKGTFVACTKKREGFDRVIIWCCASSLAINMLIGEGELSIGFLFASARLSWGVDEYALYMATIVLLGIPGTLLGAKIFQTFVDKNLSDMLIAVLASASAYAGAITKACAYKSWHLYLSTLLAVFSGIFGPVIRTALSKSALPEDMGKVFSLTTSMEAVIPVAAAPLYTMVYAHNMPPIYPSPVFLVSAGLNVFVMIMAITIDWRFWKLSSHAPADAAEEQETERRGIND